jgi:hypothetical protein
MEHMSLSRASLSMMQKTLEEEGVISKGKAKAPGTRARALYFLKNIETDIKGNLPQTQETVHVVPEENISLVEAEDYLIHEHNGNHPPTTPLLLLIISSVLPEKLGTETNIETRAYSQQPSKCLTTGKIKQELHSFAVHLSSGSTTIASVTDLAVLVAAYMIVLDGLESGKFDPNEKYVLFIDDICRKMKLSLVFNNRDRVYQALRRLNFTHISTVDVPQALKDRLHKVFFEKDFTCIQGLTVVKVEDKNSYKMPVAVKFGIDGEFLTQFDYETRRIVHKELLFERNPSGFKFKLYMFCQRSIGKHINTEDGTLTFTKNKLRLLVSPEQSNKVFNRKMKQVFENHTSSKNKIWAELWGYFFRIEHKLVRFKINKADALMSKSDTNRLEHLTNGNKQH